MGEKAAEMGLKIQVGVSGMQEQVDQERWVEVSPGKGFSNFRQGSY